MLPRLRLKEKQSVWCRDARSRLDVLRRALPLHTMPITRGSVGMVPTVPTPMMATPFAAAALPPVLQPGGQIRSRRRSVSLGCQRYTPTDKPLITIRRHCAYDAASEAAASVLDAKAKEAAARLARKSALKKPNLKKPKEEYTTEEPEDTKKELQQIGDSHPHLQLRQWLQVQWRRLNPLIDYMEDEVQKKKAEMMCRSVKKEMERARSRKRARIRIFQ